MFEPRHRMGPEAPSSHAWRIRMARGDRTSGKQQQDSEEGRVYMLLGSGSLLGIMYNYNLPEHARNRLSGGD